MDKSWMFLPRQTEEYRKGLESFLDFALSHENVNGMILCPCKRCKIGICVTREDAYDHLLVDGFIKGYTHWIAHGEISCTTPLMSTFTPPQKDTDDMQGLVHEAVRVPQHDKFAPIMGPDRHGRVRMLGDGVSPSDLWGVVPSHSTCNRIVLENKAMLAKMDEQLKKQRQQIAMLEVKISMHQSQNLGSNCSSRQPMSSTRNPLISVPSRSSLRIGCSVLIKSLFDPTKVVAKGVLHSMDPKTIVGRQPLGDNWCEIHVQVVLEPEEHLIRPYDLLQRFEDALGGMIAWPCHLV